MYFLIVHVRVHGYLAKTFFKKSLPLLVRFQGFPFGRSCDFLFCLKGGGGYWVESTTKDIC